LRAQRAKKLLKTLLLLRLFVKKIRAKRANERQRIFKIRANLLHLCNPRSNQTLRALRAKTLLNSFTPSTLCKKQERSEQNERQRIEKEMQLKQPLH
jgi:hypothetical protein